MAKAKTIKRNEDLAIFPTYIRQINPDDWRLEIAGAVYDPHDITLRKRALLKLLTRFMKIDQEAIDSPLFQQRIRTFVAAGERGRLIEVQIGDNVYTLPKKSKRNGHFSGAIHLSRKEIERLRHEKHIDNDCLAFTIVTHADDDRTLQGEAYLIPPEGVSIVSDIDDTIKFSNVSDRAELIANTFLREFRGIDNIGAHYCDWALRGIAFHYVSSSPWQLLYPLQQFFAEIDLPKGTIHLRNFRLRDQMLKRVMLIRRKGKGSAIRKLMQNFPQRKFILIGDSVERDPEIYAKLCHRFPEQVLAIWIRQWESDPMTDERIKQINKTCGKSICKSFSCSDELPSFANPILNDELG